MKGLAYSAICSRISEVNIIEEVFSEFTSMYPEIQKMEVAYLCEHFRSARVKRDFQNVMTKVVRGDLPHAAGALVAVFEGSQRWSGSAGVQSTILANVDQNHD